MKHTIDVLGANEFPMLVALRILTASQSTSPQSAPTCVSEKTEDEWQEIEVGLATMPALHFVDIAMCTERGDKLMEKYFPDWIKEWI
jgi:hypothetical protein